MSKKINCPKCNVEMNIVRQNGVETDQCPSCGGIWVDHGEKKQVFDIRPEVFTVEELKNLRKAFKPLEKLEKVKYFKCPRCQKFMWRKNYMNFSGIIIDNCRDHGTFFDKGELEKAYEFIKKGGVEFEKYKLAEEGIIETKRKLNSEITKVETTIYRLHWISRFLSMIGL